VAVDGRRTPEENLSSAAWSKAVGLSIALMIAYFVVDNHIDLYPWNNLVESQLPSTLVGVIPFSVYAVGFWFGIRWLMLVGTVHAYVWLLLQLRQWWVPYLFGPTFLHRSFGWYREGGYDETVRFLPRIGERPVPDAQHVVLEVLSLIVVVTTTMAFVKAIHQRRPRNAA
jgi:hypothetical protein